MSCTIFNISLLNRYFIGERLYHRLIMNFKLPSNPEAYLDFLQLILKTVQESDRNPQLVYSLLQANLDKLDEFLAHILQAWALSTLPQAEPEIAESYY